MKRIRVVLLRPPVDVLEKFSKLVENLAIGYLATSLRQDGHEVVLLDGMMHRWSDAEAAAEVLSLKPDLVGITNVLQYFPRSVIDLVDHLRRGGFGGTLLVGGHSVSFFPERILREARGVDAVVTGEGEQAIRDVARAVAEGTDWRATPGVASLENGALRHGRAHRIRDLDRIGSPARDLTPALIEQDGLSAVSSSRGCYARCSFCSVPRFYGLERGRALASGDWLARSVEGTIADIVDLHRRFGVREVLLVDDEFFGGSEAGHHRALELGRRLEELRLPVEFALSCRAENVSEPVFVQLMRAGLVHVFIGIESGAQTALKLYGKGHSVAQNEEAVRIVKSLGLSFQPGFMLFNYRSTLAELRTSLEFLERIGECKPITINTAVDPHFGTPLLTDMEKAGVLCDDVLALDSRFLDPRVAIAKRVAELAGAAFADFMSFIATVSSSVTYEWRRRVPGRGPAEQRLLDAFESRVNQGFSSIVGRAVRDLEERSLDAEEVIEEARAELASLVEGLRLSRALLIHQVSRVEGKLRYFSQADLIQAAGGLK